MFVYKEQRLESVHSLGFGSTLWKKIHEEESSLTSLNDSDVGSDAFIDNLTDDSQVYTRSGDRRGSVGNKELLINILYNSKSVVNKSSEKTSSVLRNQFHSFTVCLRSTGEKLV